MENFKIESGYFIANVHGSIIVAEPQAFSEICKHTSSEWAECHCIHCSFLKDDCVRSAGPFDGCPNCSSAISNKVCWHDVNTVNRDVLADYVSTPSLADMWLSLAFEEKLQLFESFTVAIDVDPVAKLHVLRGMYQHLPDIPVPDGKLGRELGSHQDWCYLSFHDRPDWDSSEPLSNIRLGYFFQLFKMALMSMDRILGVQPSADLLEVDESCLVVAMESWNKRVPLCWRWAALRAYTMMVGSKVAIFRYMFNKVNALGDLCKSHYPTVAVPESVSDVFVWFGQVLNNLLDTITGVCVDTADLIKEAIATVIGNALRAPLKALSKFHEWIAESVLKGLSSKGTKIVGLVREFLTHPLVVLSFKTMVRWWLGYSVINMVMEVCWDDKLFELTTIVLDLVVSFKNKASNALFGSNASAEADEGTTVALVVSLLIAGFTTFSKLTFNLDSDYMAKLLQNIYRTVLTMDKLHIADGVNKLKEYITGVTLGEEERSRFVALYPAAIKLIDGHVEYASNPNPLHSDKLQLRYLYCASLKERKQWDSKDMTRLTALTSVAYRECASLGSVENFQFRRQPTMFLFCGGPGLGKSILAEAACATIAKKAAPSSNTADIVYTFAPGDDYQSGYTNQTLWRFDDLFQNVDSTGSPAGDVRMMFNIFTTAPFHLNMAAVDDKGTLARCYLAVGASNVEVVKRGCASGYGTDVLRKHLKSIKQPSAVRRRLSYVVLPVVKSPYRYDQEVGRLMKGDKPLTHEFKILTSHLYEFLVFDISDTLVMSPTQNEQWTWAELLRFMWREYLLTRDYVPSDEYDDNVVLINDDDDDGEIIVEDSSPNVVSEYSSATLSHDHDLLVKRELKFGKGVSSPYVNCELPVLSNSLPPQECEPEGLYDWLPLVGSIVTATALAAASAHAVAKSSLPDFDWKPEYRDCDICSMQPTGSTMSCRAVEEWNGVAFGFEVSHPKFVTQGHLRNGLEVSGTIYVGTGDNVCMIPSDHVTAPEVLITSREGFSALFNVLGKRDVSFDEGWCVGYEQEYPRFKPKRTYRIEIVKYSEYYPHKSRAECMCRYAANIASVVIVPAVLCMAGGALSHYALSKMKQVETDDAVLIRDGTPHFYDPEDQCYKPEAAPTTRSRVYLNGKWYYKVLTKEGYKYYPEASDSENPFVQLMSKSQRLMLQLPSLRNSLYSVTRDGALLGNVFAVDPRTLLTPKHVAALIMKAPNVVMCRDAERRPLVGNFGSETNIVVQDIDDDMCLLHLFASKTSETLPNCRKQLGKFKIDVPKTGNTLLMTRDENGALVTTEGSFLMSSNDVTYTSSGVRYTLRPNQTRLCDVFSKVGSCGGIYLDLSDSAVETCMGIHVARGVEENEAGLAVMHVVTQSKISRSVSVPSTNHLPIDGIAESGLMLSDCGLHNSGKSIHKPLHRPQTKRAKSPFYRTLDCQYDLAKLHSVTNSEGITIDPLRKALTKLGKRVSEPVVGGDGMIDVVKALVADYKPHFKPFQRSVPSFQQAVRTDCGLPAVQRLKAAGDPYYSFGGLKKIAFVEGDLNHTLVPDYLEFLETYDKWLCPDDWATRPASEFPVAESTGNGALKDEPRVFSKVAECSTRLFISLNMHEFIEERRYFSDIVNCWSTLNVTMSSALGVAPEDFDVIDSKLREAGDDALILALDHEHMDGHVRPRMMRLLAIFAVELTDSFDHVNGRWMDPHLAKVDRRGFMMMRLLYRLSWFILKIGDAVVEPGTSHPSGSFLTSWINHMVQELLTVWCLSKMLGITYTEVVTCCPRVFVGDDSLVAIPSRFKSKVDVVVYKNLMAEQGFVVTAATKDDELDVYQLWDHTGMSCYQFLSRKFYLQPSGSIVGVLDPTKAERSISFFEKKKFHENMPSQMLSFLNELRMGWDCPWYQPFHAKWRKALDVIEPGFLDKALIAKPEYVQLKVLSFCNRHTIQAVAQAGGEPEVQESHQTTQFATNMDCDQVDAQPVHRGEMWRMAGMDKALSKDVELFSRPVAIYDGIWEASSPTNLFFARMPTAYFNSNNNARAKLMNYLYLRGVAVVRVVITSSPYTAGKAILGVRPSCVPGTPTVYEIAACPSVEIDASSGKEVELRVPCVLPHGFAVVQDYANVVPNTYARLFDWADFYLMIISGIDDVSDAPVNFRVYAWIEDPVVFAPTSIPLYEPGIARAQGKEGDLGPKPTHYYPDPDMKLNPFSIPVFSSFQKSVVGPAQSSESNRLSAGIDKYVTPTIKAIGGAAVEIGTIVLAGAKIAMLMGLSAPNISNNTMLMQQVRNFDGHHVSGVCPSLMMAGAQHQKVVLPVNTFSIGNDEMSIAHYCSRFGYVDMFQFTASNHPGDALTSITINPGLLKTRGPSPPPTREFSPLSFASMFFQLWRGSIVYRLAAAKTQFHAGILEIAWKIGYNDDTLDEDGAANCYRIIWNLAESSSIQFTVPYISALPWSQTRILGLMDEIGATDTNLSGQLFIRVVTPLMAASSGGGALVTESINILVYMAGGPDIEFAVPRSPTAVTTLIPPPTPSAIACVPEGREDGVFQGDRTSGIGCCNTTTVLGNAHPLSQMGRITCIGEEMVSFRSLTRRFGTVLYDGFLNGSGDTPTLIGPRIMQDHVFINMLSKSFAYISGGYRVEVIPHNMGPRDKAILAARLILNGKLFDETPTTFQSISVGESYVYGVPWYNLVPYVPVSQFFTVGGSNTGLALQTSVYAGVFEDDTIEAYFRSAGGDDFNMGWQIGPPPMQIEDSTLGTTIPYCGFAPGVSPHPVNMANKVKRVPVSNPKDVAKSLNNGKPAGSFIPAKKL